MDKETREMFKELNETLSKFLKRNKEKTIIDRLKEASKDEFKIVVERGEDGITNVDVEGERLAILVGLAGLENHLLKELETPDEIWEIIKQVTDTEEVE